MIDLKELRENINIGDVVKLIAYKEFEDRKNLCSHNGLVIENKYHEEQEWGYILLSITNPPDERDWSGRARVYYEDIISYKVLEKAKKIENE